MMKTIADEVSARNEPYDYLYSNDFIVEYLEGKYGKDVIADLLVQFCFKAWVVLCCFYQTVVHFTGSIGTSVF